MIKSKWKKYTRTNTEILPRPQSTRQLVLSNINPRDSTSMSGFSGYLDKKTWADDK